MGKYFSLMQNKNLGQKYHISPKPEMFDLLEGGRNEPGCLLAETFNIFFLVQFSHFFWSPPHKNSLQCLSMSCKRNQEPVDISLQAFPFLVFGVFHIFMFWRSSIFHWLQTST